MNDGPNSTLADLDDWLRAQGVSYAVIGGIATTVRGEPRFTADVDVVVGIDLDRALQLLDSLISSPFRPLFTDVADVVKKAFILPIRHISSGIRVDMAIGMTGFERQLIARATEATIGGRSIPVATAEDLILLKVLAGRPRDVDDVSRIVLRQGPSLNWNYIMETGEQLQQAVDVDLVPQLRRFREGHDSST